MWRHRPVGRVMISLAIALLALAALGLDAMAGIPGDPMSALPIGASGLLAWHALSTLGLAGLALWALWSSQLPRGAGSALVGLAGLLLLGAMLVAAQQLPVGGEGVAGAVPLPLLVFAAVLFGVGARWARREIRW